MLLGSHTGRGAVRPRRHVCLMNEIPELVYVSDLENYDLLLVNTAGRETFLEGQSGTQVLQAAAGRDATCPFCTNAAAEY